MQSTASTTFMVRTVSDNPSLLANVLRAEVRRVRPELRVSNLRTQTELDSRHTVREGLLAKLGLFFSVVAILLVGVGLYGVVNSTVVQRRHEIGSIRLAIGAPARDIVRRVVASTLAVVFAGATAGLLLGIAFGRFAEKILYHVKPTDVRLLAYSTVVLLTVALAGSVPGIRDSARIRFRYFGRSSASERLPVVVRYNYGLFHQIEKRIVETVARHIVIRYGVTDVPVTLEQPRQTSFGELALPIAFQLAKPLRQPPKKIAQELVDELGEIEGVAAMEVAGNGYINVRFDRGAVWRDPAYRRRKTAKSADEPTERSCRAHEYQSRTRRPTSAMSETRFSGTRSYGC